MKLFFDTETTGVPKNYKAPVTDLENWPRMVQIGWITYDDIGNNLSSVERIVKPDDFIIPNDVSKIHGITQEIALEMGIPISTILNQFNSDLSRSDILVGHNLSYDLNVLGAEFIRCFGNNPLQGKPAYCTMLSSINLCKLPGKYGTYKWPKLSELYGFIFKTDMGHAHTALADIENTAKCYFEMKRLGIETVKI